MDSNTGISDHNVLNQRNVRPRINSPTHAESHEGKEQQQEQQSSSSTTNIQESRHKNNQSNSSLEKIVADGGNFFLITEEIAYNSMGHKNPSSIFEEVDRCWAEHRKTGKMHHEAPWRLCSSAADNREHPYYVQWLDTMELPPLEELLRKDSSNGITADNSNRSEENKINLKKENESLGDEKLNQQNENQEIKIGD